jgi:hypothetical protein
VPDHDTVTADDVQDHDDREGSEAAEQARPAPLPPRTRQYKSTSGWQAMARPGLPHPTWWHPLNLTTWTGAVGLGVAALEPSHLASGIGTVVAGWLGSGVAAAAVGASRHQATDDYLVPAAWLGGLTGLGMGGWAWIASANDLFNDMWQPVPWAILGAAGVAFGAAYTGLRYRIAAARNPLSRVHHRNKMAKASGTWGEIMQRAGFGQVTVDAHEENWSGYTVWLRLDPDRNDTSRSVANAKNKIVGVACRVLSDQDTAIGDDDITISHTRDAMVVAVRVRLRDVLTAVIDPPAETGPVRDTDALIESGRWEDGNPIELAESGPHGCAIGTTGSGKSTYEYGLTAQWSRRKHILNWTAGISKFETFIKPWIQPVIDGDCTRPVFDMLGGGSGGSEDEFWSAAKVVAAGYKLMRLRQSSSTIPRVGGKVVISPDHPRVVIQLDEVDALVGYKLTGKDGTSGRPRFVLDNGEAKTVFEMMCDIGSKGRSEGIELEVSTQRLTDSFWGGVSIRDFLNNVHRRAAFFTMSRHDAAEMLKGTKLDSVNLKNNSMYMAISADAPPMAGKACYYDDEAIAGYAVRADLDDTIGGLNMTEAAALGELYTGRWNPDRVGTLLAYFAADRSPTFRAFLDTRVTATTTPAPSSTAKAPTQPDPGSGFQQVRDAVAKVKRDLAEQAAAEAGVGRHDPTTDLLDQLWRMPPVDDTRRNVPAPSLHSIVDQVLALFGDAESGHVASVDIAERLGRVPVDASELDRQTAASAVAQEITAATGLEPAQRRNAARYDGRTRGFLLEELRRHRGR